MRRHLSDRRVGWSHGLKAAGHRLFVRICRHLMARWRKVRCLEDVIGMASRENVGKSGLRGWHDLAQVVRRMKSRKSRRRRLHAHMRRIRHFASNSHRLRDGRFSFARQGGFNTNTINDNHSQRMYRAQCAEGFLEVSEAITSRLQRMSGTAMTLNGHISQTSKGNKHRFQKLFVDFTRQLRTPTNPSISTDTDIQQNTADGKNLHLCT